MGSRYYDPRLGRFLSIDPVEPDENNLHSLNRYAYANNNPYKFTDPDGQIAETIIDVVSLGLSINAFRQAPGFINGLAVAYDGFATAVPFLPAGFGIIRQAASKGEKLTEVVKQAADRGAAKAGEGAQKVAQDQVRSQGGKSLSEQAADLVPQNSNRNRVTLRSPSQKMEVDLAGRSHGDVPTPHTKVSPRNLDAPTQPAYNTKNSPVRPATQQDIRTVRRFLERQAKP